MFNIITCARLIRTYVHVYAILDIKNFNTYFKSLTVTEVRWLTLSHVVLFTTSIHGHTPKCELKGTAIVLKQPRTMEVPSRLCNLVEGLNHCFHVKV